MWFSNLWLNDRFSNPITPNTVDKEQDVYNKTLGKLGEEHIISCGTEIIKTSSSRKNRWYPVSTKEDDLCPLVLHEPFERGPGRMCLLRPRLPRQAVPGCLEQVQEPGAVLTSALRSEHSQTMITLSRSFCGKTHPARSW